MIYWVSLLDFKLGVRENRESFLFLSKVYIINFYLMEVICKEFRFENCKFWVLILTVIFYLNWSNWLRFGFLFVKWGRWCLVCEWY